MAKDGPAVRIGCLHLKQDIGHLGKEIEGRLKSFFGLILKTGDGAGTHLSVGTRTGIEKVSFSLSCFSYFGMNDSRSLSILAPGSALHFFTLVCHAYKEKFLNSIITDSE